MSKEYECKNKILLIAPEQDMKGDIVSNTEKSEVIGLGYLNAYLKQRGVDCEITNLSLENIVLNDIVAVGLSVLASNYKNAIDLSKGIKERGDNIKVIWGGHQATNYFEDVLKDGTTDFVIHGEGEKSFYNLVRNLIDRTSIENTKGIAYFNNGNIITNQKEVRLSSQELDSIDFKLIHNESTVGKMALPYSVPFSEMRLANVQGSRGCWNNCSFCSSEAMWGRMVISRSTNNIVDEVEYLVNNRRINYVFFTDDDFFTNKGRALNIANEIIKRRINVSYSVMASVRTILPLFSYELKLMKDSGCTEIAIGMESSSQIILDETGKGYDIKNLGEVSSNIVNNKINLGLYYMLGFPHQSNEDLDNDYNLLNELPFSRIRPTFLVPYPGTRLYKQVEEQNLWMPEFRNNWSHFNCETPVIKSIASVSQLKYAREKIFELYNSQKYLNNLRLIGNSDKAIEEFFDFKRKEIRKCLK